MKYLITFVCVLLFCSAKSQTLTYYNYPQDGNWKAITVLIPPVDTSKAVCYYNSRDSKSIIKVNELKDASKDGIHASVVNLGDDKTKYLLILADSGKKIVLSDEKQIFTCVFDLDSKLFNPVVNIQSDKKTGSLNTTALFNAFKFLFLL